MLQAPAHCCRNRLFEIFLDRGFSFRQEIYPSSEFFAWSNANSGVISLHRYGWEWYIEYARFCSMSMCLMSFTESKARACTMWDNYQAHKTWPVPDNITSDQVCEIAFQSPIKLSKMSVCYELRGVISLQFEQNHIYQSSIIQVNETLT